MSNPINKQNTGEGGPRGPPAPHALRGADACGHGVGPEPGAGREAAYAGEMMRKQDGWGGMEGACGRLSTVIKPFAYMPALPPFFFGYLNLNS